MEPRKASLEEEEEDGSSSVAAAPPLRRRLSMEEDLFYQQIMSSPPRRPSLPPPYDSISPTLIDNPTAQRTRSSRPGPKSSTGPEEHSGMLSLMSMDEANTSRLASMRIHDNEHDGSQARRGSHQSEVNESLPGYSTSIHMEGIFSKKHEIENTTKRAEDRQWHTNFISLNGTSLNIHSVKRDWGWGRTPKEGPSVSPDNPPWVKKAKLEKSYSLQHADAGIAADYKKRRYVIRIRAETDQFLLSCVELSTFVNWLEALFAAIDVAAPIDERDFPRDMSIPRIQRVRWFGNPPHIVYPPDVPRTADPNAGGDDEDAPSQVEAEALAESSLSARSAFSSESQSQRPPRFRLPPEAIEEMPEDDVAVASGDDEMDEEEGFHVPPRIDPAHRLSTTSYPNAAIDPHSGKWFPDHQWSSAHDLLYAKLCYNNLLFRSPRKTNYIIREGKQWFVEWSTGKMVRVLPPNYGESDHFGPWQVIHTDNRRI